MYIDLVSMCRSPILANTMIIYRLLRTHTYHITRIHYTHIMGIGVVVELHQLSNFHIYLRASRSRFADRVDRIGSAGRSSRCRTRKKTRVAQPTTGKSPRVSATSTPPAPAPPRSYQAHCTTEARPTPSGSCDARTSPVLAAVQPRFTLALHAQILSLKLVPLPGCRTP